MMIEDFWEDTWLLEWITSWANSPIGDAPKWVLEDKMPIGEGHFTDVIVEINSSPGVTLVYDDDELIYTMYHHEHQGTTEDSRATGQG